MLEALKFVQRGVARRDFVPGLQHFRIAGGRVTGYNGEFSLSAPVDIGFNIAPHAVLFTRALDSCEDVIALQHDGNHLQVRSGDFECNVPCIALDQVPETFPEGDVIPSHGSVLEALTSLRPFIGVDASRPWATGILLDGQSAYATNNVIVTEYWLGTPFSHRVNIPSSVVDEVVRVKEELVSMQISDKSITFHYADGRWIKSALLSLEWPDVPGVMQSAWDGASLHKVPAGFLHAVEKLARSCDKKEGRIYMRGTDISTRREGAVDGGAVVRFPTVPEKGCYHPAYLSHVLEVAEAIDFAKYPGPVPFMGHNLRGVMMGIHE